MFVGWPKRVTPKMISFMFLSWNSISISECYLFRTFLFSGGKHLNPLSCVGFTQYNVSQILQEPCLSDFFPGFFLPFFFFLFFDFLISNNANCSWFLPFFLTVCCVICFYCCSHLQHLVKYCLQDISMTILLLDTRYLHMLHRNVFFKNLFDCYFWQHYWEAFNLKLWTYDLNDDEKFL